MPFYARGAYPTTMTTWAVFGSHSNLRHVHYGWRPAGLLSVARYVFLLLFNQMGHMKARVKRRVMHVLASIYAVKKI